MSRSEGLRFESANEISRLLVQTHLLAGGVKP